MSSHHEEFGYDRMLRKNLAWTFSERDAGRRSTAIREFGADDAIVHEGSDGTRCARPYRHEPSSPQLSTMKALAAVLALSCSFAAVGQDMHRHGHKPAPDAHAAVRFVASSDRRFEQLMSDAMAVMDRDMGDAPMTGEPGHDFVTMMLPHHQGAIDMAKAVLLHTKDPELRNLALGIIAEQQNEINVMRAWLRRRTPTGK